MFELGSSTIAMEDEAAASFFANLDGHSASNNTGLDQGTADFFATLDNHEAEKKVTYYIMS